MSATFTPPPLRTLLVTVVCAAALAAPRLTDAQQASELVNYDFVDDVLVENDGGINSALLGPVQTIIARRLAAQAKGTQGGEYPRPFEVEFRPRSDSDRNMPRRVYSLHVQWIAEGYANKDYDEDARRFWGAARQELEKRLRIVQRQTHEAHVQQWQTEHRRIEQAYAEARARLDGVTDEMKAKGDVRLIEQVRGELQAAVAQQRQLDLERVGAQARRKAIEARIDDLRELAKLESSDDPIVAELRNAVEIRQKTVEFRKTLQQVASPGGEAIAVNDAEAAWAEARIQLLKAERDAADRAQGTVLAELNNELSMLIIETAELDEKSKALDQLVEKLQDQASPDNVAEVELLERERRDAQDAVGNLRQELRDHERQAPAELEQITIRPLEEALFGDDEAAAAEESQP